MKSHNEIAGQTDLACEFFHSFWFDCLWDPAEKFIDNLGQFGLKSGSFLEDVVQYFVGLVKPRPSRTDYGS